MNKDIIYHLLIPGDFRIYCLPNREVGSLNITMLASRANCANCLTKFRIETNGRKTRFRVRYTDRHNP